MILVVSCESLFVSFLRADILKIQPMYCDWMSCYFANVDPIRKRYVYWIVQSINRVMILGTGRKMFSLKPAATTAKFLLSSQSLQYLVLRYNTHFPTAAPHFPLYYSVSTPIVAVNRLHLTHSIFWLDWQWNVAAGERSRVHYRVHSMHRLEIKICPDSINIAK